MLTVLLYLLVGIVGIAIGFGGRCIYAKLKLTSAEQKAKVLEENASKNAEAKAKEIIIETRDKLLKEQQQQESEARDRRAELQKSERRLQQKEENLERKQQENDSVTKQLGEKEAALKEREDAVEKRESDLDLEYEKVAQMSRDEAKNILIEQMKQKAEHDGQVYVNKIEQEAQLLADKKARDIIITSIQRLATEVSGEITTSLLMK